MLISLLVVALSIAYLPKAIIALPFDGLLVLLVIIYCGVVLSFKRFRGYKLWTHWVPWTVVLGIGLIRNPDPVAAYRSMLFMMPIIVAWTTYVSIGQLEVQRGQLIYISRCLLGFVLFGAIWTIFVSGVHTSWEFIRAGGAVTATALGITIYALEERASQRFLWLIVCLMCPLIGENRMAFLVTALIPVLMAFSIRPSISRIVLGILAGVTFLELLINVPSMAEKMFYSGNGSLLTFVQDPSDIRTHGRTLYFVTLISEMHGIDWLVGHGANRSSDYIAAAITGQNQPHNDWLRILFDYGAVGVFVFSATLIAEFRRLRRISDNAFAVVGRIGLCALALLMFTGNVALYGVFYGNLIFYAIGLSLKEKYFLLQYDVSEQVHANNLAMDKPN